jgi:hypothetical protein
MATYTELNSIIGFEEALKMHALLDYKYELEKSKEKKDGS